MNELQLERQDREELQTQVGGWGAGQGRALSPRLLAEHLAAPASASGRSVKGAYYAAVVLSIAAPLPPYPACRL
jgi:hypothetical protein